MLEAGEVERLSRGLYAFAQEGSEHFTLVSVCKRVPQAIVCLLSALRFHDIGTQMPREVWIAIPHKARKPHLPDLPVRVVRFSGPMLHHGIETRTVDGTPVRITSPARTVVDCFRYRNKVGLDVALEALHDAFQERKATMGEIHRAAEMCRAKSIVPPYLHSLAR
jgi:predicted transcriptional regulator of viral defense system